MLIGVPAAADRRDGHRAAGGARRDRRSRWSRSRAPRARRRWTRCRRRRRSSGYKAALLAAERLPRFFPMLMTAAGTIAPAKVLVLGAGVAGLQAIATARRLGAVVSGFDVRPAVKEQVSRSARRSSTSASSARRPRAATRGADAGEQAQQQAELGERIAGVRRRRSRRRSIPGRPAPRLIPADAVERDAARLGDRRPRRGDRRQLRADRARARSSSTGVTIVGLTNLPATMPHHASQLYSRNVAALLAHLAHGRRAATSTGPTRSSPAPA